MNRENERLNLVQMRKILRTKHAISSLSFDDTKYKEQPQQPTSESAPQNDRSKRREENRRSNPPPSNPFGSQIFPSQMLNLF